MDRTNIFRTPLCGALLAASALLAGCGSGDGFDRERRAAPLGPTFDSIQANVFEPICEHCHSGANAPAGLRLDAANSYSLLVGIASGERPNLLRVAPGDPNNSYLIQKLEGRPAIGERMPAGLPAVAASRHRRHSRSGSPTAHSRRASTSGTDPRHVAVARAELPRCSRLPTSITFGFQSRCERAVRHDGDVHAAARRRRRRSRQADDVAVTPASVTVPAANRARRS